MRATMEDAIETAATKREDRRTRERVAMSERIAGSFPREREKKREGRERERERRRSQGRVRERKREVGRESVDTEKEKDIGGKKAREGETRARGKKSQAGTEE